MLRGRPGRPIPRIEWSARPAMLLSPSTADTSRQRVLFQTRQPESAVEFVGRLYGAHTLTLRPSGDLDMRLSGFELAELNLSTVRYGCPAMAQLLDERDAWVFSLVLNGSTQLGGETAVAGFAGALAPERLRSIPMSSDFELVNLRVKAGLMSEAYRALFGHHPERGFSLPELMPPASPSARALSGLIARLACVPVYSHPGAPAMERRLQEAALFEILMSWPHPNAARLGAQASVPRSARVARDFIEAHLLDSPTLTDIAAASGVGVRALTRSFKRTYSVSPMGYMSGLRLERAREELRNATPGTTVTNVAYRWGFSNLGDFAAAYARRFSELPSTTLRSRTGLAVNSSG